MPYKQMNYAHVIDQLGETPYRVFNMNIKELINTFPDYAKDIRLNYSKILNEDILNKKQLYSIILIASFTTQLNSLKDAALEETKEFINEELMEDVYGAYSIMSMNAIYYRFTHLTSENDYFTMPANLRMQYLSKFKIDKSVDSYGSNLGPLKGLIGTSDSRMETITLIGSINLIKLAESYIHQIDKPLKQIAMKVRILDINIDDEEDLANSFALKTRLTKPSTYIFN